jgi:hypothetical protein
LTFTSRASRVRQQSPAFPLTSLEQSDDDRIAIMAAQAILDRGYGKPVQAIEANISDGYVRYVEVPRKAENAEAWLQQQASASAEAASDKLN